MIENLFQHIIIFDIHIAQCNYDDLNSVVTDAIDKNVQCCITYVTANSLNLAYNNKKITQFLNSFDIVHPDGEGAYLASKMLYGNNGFSEKITGSDWYPQLIQRATEKQWKFFLFGDTDKTLKKAVSQNPDLNISGVQNGYTYQNENLIPKINDSEPDVLIVGMGCPKQEEWIIKHKEMLHVPVIIAVGDGLKVFAGTKVRGPGWMQRLGLEWIIRLIQHPIRFFYRYIIGNPLFIMRVRNEKRRNK